MNLCRVFTKAALTATVGIVSCGWGAVFPAPAQAGPSGNAGISFTVQLPADWENSGVVPPAAKKIAQIEAARVSTATVEARLHAQETVAAQQTSSVFRDQYWVQQTTNDEQVSLEVF